MTETQKNPLAESFNALSLIRFAFPSMVMMLFMGLYTIVDTIFVARFVDTNALSSINIVCPVINLIVGLGTMLATGGSAVIAKKMGNGNIGEARSNFTLIVVAGAVIGLLITAAGLLFLDEIIWGLGASEILFPYCRDYLTIQLIFAAFHMMQVLYQNLFVTAGKPTLDLMLAVLAGTRNIVLALSQGFPYLYFCFPCLAEKVLQRYLRRTTGMFLRLQRMDLSFFHSAFCSLDAIFFHLHYLRHYPMGKRLQPYLSCGRLDLLWCSFWHCRDF